MAKKIIIGFFVINIVVAVSWNILTKGGLKLDRDGVYELGEDVDYSNSAKILFDNGTSETIIIELPDDHKLKVSAGAWELLRTNAGHFRFISTAANGAVIDVLTPNLNPKEYYVYNPRLKWKHFLKSVSYGVGITFEKASDPGYEIAPDKKFFVVKNQYHTLPVHYFFTEVPETIETYNGMNRTIRILKHFPADNTDPATVTE